ncbi:TonB-dependent receptor [Kamptonema cortianum]|nr:TonB-dependent receptor [Kamptonema cortianum]
MGHKQTCAITAVGLALSTGAWGSEASAQDATEGQNGLEDIVVTAQRRAEKLQQVPIQVAAFSAEKIEDAGIKSTRDFVNLVPNVSFDETFTYLNSFVVVRGVTQINNADSPVAVIVDGVPQNNQKQLRMNLFDVERIEVLMGPQGGLYGRTAIGGAINIITKAPSDSFEGAVTGSYGRGDAIDLTGVISAPLGPDTGFRLAGSFKTDNGRIQNTFTNENVDFIDHDWELRAKLTTKFSERISLDLRAAYRKFEAGAVYDSIVFSGRADDYQLPNSNIEGQTTGNIFDGSAKLDFELGDVTITSITAHTDLTENYRGDLDFSNPVDKPGGFQGLGIQVGQGQDLRVKLTSQELRLVSSNDGPLRWILGGFYLHTKRNLLTRAFLDLNSSIEQIDNDALVILRIDESNNNDAYAVYANIDYDISDRLILSGSLRYDRDDRRQRDVSTGTIRETSFDSLQPKATITYKVTPEQLVYATYSTGFRSGGFNAPAVSIPIYNDEEIENFEAGFKTSWMNRRLIVNGAVYTSKIDDFQFFFIDVNTASQIIGNIDRVSIWGVELEMQAIMAKGFQIFGGVGTTDSRINRNDRLPETVGNRTPRSTEWMLNAGFQFDTRISDAMNFRARLDYQHQGQKFWQVTNLDVQEPINLVDVRAGIEGDKWEIFLSGRNIFGEKFYADFNPTAFSGLDTAIGFRGQPAIWAVESRVRF